LNRRLSTIALAALLAAPRALAFPTSRLIYERGAGAEHCPAEPIVRGRVADRLGYDPFVEEAARTLVARVFRVGDRLEADVQLVDQLGKRHGSRHLATDTGRCDELISALALSISIAIDPERVQTEEDFVPPPETETPASGRSAGDRPESRTEAPAIDGEPKAPVHWDTGVEDEREPRRPFSVRWHSGAGGLAAIGSAPAPTGGAFVFVSAELGQALLSLEGRADAPAFTDAAGGEASSSLLVASVVPCWQPNALFACAVGSIGAVRGRGDRVTQARSDSGFYAAAGIRLGSTLPLYERLSLRLHLDLLSTLTRFTLEIDDQPVWKAPPFSSAAGLALAAHFP
jgi:hypothetical protein